MRQCGHRLGGTPASQLCGSVPTVLVEVLHGQRGVQSRHLRVEQWRGGALLGERPAHVYDIVAKRDY